MKKQEEKKLAKAETIEINGVKASPYVTAYLTPEEYEKAKDKIVEGGFETETLKNGKIAVSRFFPDFQERITSGFAALSKEDVLYFATSEYITSEFRDIERASIMSSIGLEPEKAGRVSKADKDLLNAIKIQNPEEYATLLKKFGVKI